VVYDVRRIFPQFDRYHQEQADVRNHIQQIDGKDIRLMGQTSAAAAHQANGLAITQFGTGNAAGQGGDNAAALMGQ